MLRTPSLLLLLLVSWNLTACNPREWPGIKQFGQRETDRITRETDEAIKKSPALQALNQICTHEIPLPGGFLLVAKSRDFNEEKFLSYGYRAFTDYETVRKFYLDNLPPRGWQLTERKDCCWGPSKLVFRKGEFSVTIYDKEYGDDATYGIVCQKL